MWDSVLEEWQKTRGDLFPPQPNMVSLGLGSVAALLQHPKLQQNKPPVCQLTVYTEHFFSAELVPNLPNNTKCHLFGTWCIQPSSLLHYAFNCGACQSWKVWGDFSYQTHASRCVFPPHGLKLALICLLNDVSVGFVFILLWPEAAGCDAAPEQQHDRSACFSQKALKLKVLCKDLENMNVCFMINILSRFVGDI